MRCPLDNYNGRRARWTEGGYRLEARTHVDHAYPLHHLGEVSDVQRGHYSIVVDCPDGRFFNPPKFCESVTAAFRLYRALCEYKATGLLFIALEVTAHVGAEQVACETLHGWMQGCTHDWQAIRLDVLATRLLRRLRKETNDG